MWSHPSLYRLGHMLLRSKQDALEAPFLPNLAVQKASQRSGEVGVYGWAGWIRKTTVKREFNQLLSLQLPRYASHRSFLDNKQALPPINKTNQFPFGVSSPPQLREGVLMSNRPPPNPLRSQLIMLLCQIFAIIGGLAAHKHVPIVQNLLLRYFVILWWIWEKGERK